MDGKQRLSGVVVSVYPSLSANGGSFGEIRETNGALYVWNAGHVYRNMSHAKMGAVVTFEAVGSSYATNIDSTGRMGD